MRPVLTPAQQDFVDHLRMQNTDHRAVQIVTAAFHVRNATPPNIFPNPTEARDVLVSVIDKVAG